MPRHSSNFQVTQLLDSSCIGTCRSNFNDFGNFIYKDHVTRKKYDVNHLKTTSTIHQSKQNSYFTSTSHRNINNSLNFNNQKNLLNKNITKYYNKQNDDEMQIKKHQLSHFLRQLQMLNRIKNNRNYIVSGNQKAQKRKSVVVSCILPDIKHKNQLSNIDMLKQQVRKQVNTLNNELFRQYLTDKQPYRIVFGELNQSSSKGALNTNKLKQIKQKIKECTKEQNDQNTVASTIIKKSQLENKEIEKFDNYFNNVWKQLNEQIHLKMRQESSFNWKYGKKSTLDKIVQDYGNQLKLENNS